MHTQCIRSTAGTPLARQQKQQQRGTAFTCRQKIISRWFQFQHHRFKVRDVAAKIRFVAENLVDHEAACCNNPKQETSRSCKRVLSGLPVRKVVRFHETSLTTCRRVHKSLACASIAFSIIPMIDESLTPRFEFDSNMVYSDGHEQ